MKIKQYIERYHYIIVALLMIVAILVRSWDFPNIPAGVNQDEASIAYDAYAIGNYGVDRNGNHLPVYPIGFGNGHGPLSIYIAIPLIKLLGLNIFAFRLTNLLLACVAVFMFYLISKRLFGKNMSLVCLAIIATAPTSIISARWSLDSNPLPSIFIIATYFFVKAIDTKKTWTYIVAIFIYGLSLYQYGPAIVTVPIFLTLSFIYLLVHKKITFKKSIMCAIIFVLTVCPLMIDLAMNFFRVERF